MGFFPSAFYVIGLLVRVDFYEYSKLKRLQLDCEINRAIKKNHCHYTTIVNYLQANFCKNSIVAVSIVVIKIKLLCLSRR